MRTLGHAATLALALAVAACSSDVTEPETDDFPRIDFGPPQIVGGGECPVGLGCVRRTGVVHDYVTRAPLAGVSVDILDRSTDGIVAQLTTDASGGWDTGWTIPFGTPLRVIISRAGYVTRDASANTIVYLVPVGYDSGSDGALTGSVRFTNGGMAFRLPGTTIEVFGGSEATGVPIATAVADSLGEFAIGGLPVGDHAVRLSAPYFADTVRVWTLQAGNAVNVGLHMVLDVPEVRFALTWTAAIRDLDLVVELREGQANASPTLLRIDHANRGSCDAPPFACLDADVRDASGAETITIRDVVSRPYRVYVNNHTAWAQGSGPLDNSLAASGAKVAVYVGDDLISTESVPDGAGRTWFSLSLATPVIQRPAYTQRFPATFDWTAK